MLVYTNEYRLYCYQQNTSIVGSQPTIVIQMLVLSRDSQACS